MIPDEKIPEIRERTDVVALIQQYVSLKRVGASFRGLCPFHGEKTPSFYVHPSRQFFHCFGCQVSGDVITFYMRIEGLTFPEALRQLAERAGVELPAGDARTDADVRNAKARRERLVAVMDAAAGFYVQRLKDHPLAEIARAELKRRNIEPATAEAFRLGYAPHGWDALSVWLGQQGHSMKDAEELGLVVPRKSGGGYYDRFRHRLLFPVSDHNGRIVAFSGRILDAPPDEPLSDRNTEPAAKYVNSPENPLFRKSEVLFGLHEGRVDIRQKGWVVVCEGNFDLVALHQAGFQNAVAPLGTAFTPEHAKLLKRFAQRVVLMFDGDKAGRKAVRTAFPLLTAVGLASKVVRLPADDDPDTVLRREGPEALLRRIEAAPSILEHLIDEAADEAAGDPAQMSAAIANLGPILQALDNPVEIRLYVERIARKFQISDIEAVRQQLRRGVRDAKANVRPPRDGGRGAAPVVTDAPNVPGDYSGSAGGRPPGPGRDAPFPPNDTGRDRGAGPGDRSASPTARRPENAASDKDLPLLQCELVGVVLDSPALLGTEDGQKLEALLTSTDLKSIFQNATRIYKERARLDAVTLMTSLDENGSAIGNGTLRWLTERLAIQKYETDTAGKALKEGIPRLAQRNIEVELPKIEAQIHAARRAGNEEHATALTKEHFRLFRSAHQLTNPVQQR